MEWRVVLKSEALACEDLIGDQNVITTLIIWFSTAVPIYACSYHDWSVLKVMCAVRSGTPYRHFYQHQHGKIY